VTRVLGHKGLSSASRHGFGSLDAYLWSFVGAVRS
jgi:hypothetical protein